MLEELLPLPRSAEAFDDLLSRLAGAVPGVLADLSSRSLEILMRHREVVAALEGLVGDRFDGIVADVVDQLGSLVYRGFVAGLGSDRLDDVERYLRGARYRVERVREHLDRDSERQGKVNALEAEHDALVTSLGWTPDLIEVAWSLQELRMSLFAQPIGVSGAVSEKRIRAALREAAS